MNCVALDLETTGLNPERCYILEIGAIKIKNGNIEDVYETLVQCPVPIDERIQELTGITDEMVREGKSERQAVQELLEFAGNLPLLGHNIPFDYGFLQAAVMRQGMNYQAKGIDTLKIAKKVLPDIEKRSLEYLCNYYKIETKQSHRALEDAKAAYQLYQILKETYSSEKAVFQPATMDSKRKKQEPVTEAQKKYLQALLNYHHLTLPVPAAQLSKSEASRRIDEIIRDFGRIPRFY